MLGQEMCLFKGSANWREKFPHWNWIVLLGLNVVTNVILTITAPSLYQFITTPREIPREIAEDDEGQRFWPGLGGNETQFAWALLAMSIGAACTTVLAARICDKCGYTFPIFSCLVFWFVAGLLYANSTQLWMVVLAQFMVGVGVGSSGGVCHSYWGEMTIKWDEIRQEKKKKPVKDALYIIYLFMTNIGFVIAFGITSIFSQFEDVNPYHWPGYFNASLAVIYSGVVLLTFQEVRPLPKLNQFKLDLSCRFWSGLKIVTQSTGKWKADFVVYVYLVLCGMVNGLYYSILYTLTAPVLSDRFGFSVKYTAYFFNGVAVAHLGSAFLLLLVKLFKIDNRKIAGLLFMLAFVGVALIGDWQEINQKEPCSVIELMNADQMTGSGNHFLSTRANSSSLFCDARNGSNRECYWNPQSQITGEFCSSCLPVCLSRQSPIDFYQFTCGMLILALTYPMAYVLNSAIASGVSPLNSQGTITSCVIGSFYLSNILSPLWLIESYKFSGNHNYINAGITCLILLSMMAGLVALFRKLAPRQSRSSELQKTWEANNPIEPDDIIV